MGFGFLLNEKDALFKLNTNNWLIEFIFNYFLITNTYSYSSIFKLNKEFYKTLCAIITLIAKTNHELFVITAEWAK